MSCQSCGCGGDSILSGGSGGGSSDYSPGAAEDAISKFFKDNVICPKCFAFWLAVLVFLLFLGRRS